jgi:hypothetical protein
MGRSAWLPDARRRNPADILGPAYEAELAIRQIFGPEDMCQP